MSFALRITLVDLATSNPTERIPLRGGSNSGHCLQWRTTKAKTLQEVVDLMMTVICHNV